MSNTKSLEYIEFDDLNYPSNNSLFKRSIDIIMIIGVSISFALFFVFSVRTLKKKDNNVNRLKIIDDSESKIYNYMYSSFKSLKLNLIIISFFIGLIVYVFVDKINILLKK